MPDHGFSHVVDGYDSELEGFRLDVTTKGKYTRHHSVVDPTQFETWTRIDQLGSGGYGIVFLERCSSSTATTKLRAVKRVPKPPGPQSNLYLRELKAMARLARPRYKRWFVEMYGWFETSTKLCIAMEYFPQGDLQKHLKTSGAMPEIQVKPISMQLLGGLACLHGLGFTHRDLKPNNILVASKTPWHVKIGDFGISKRVQQYDTVLRTREVGTDGYRAPEVWMHGDASLTSYDSKVDIWSLGETVFFMLTGQHSMTPEQQFKYYQGDIHFPVTALKERNISQAGRDFITSIMAARPQDRPSAASAAQHVWLAESDLDGKTLASRSDSWGQGTASTTSGDSRRSSVDSHQPSAKWSTVGTIEQTIYHTAPEARTMDANGNHQVLLGRPRSPSGRDVDQDRSPLIWSSSGQEAPIPSSSLAKSRPSASWAQPDPWANAPDEKLPQRPSPQPTSDTLSCTDDPWASRSEHEEPLRRDWSLIRPGNWPLLSTALARKNGEQAAQKQPMQAINSTLLDSDSEADTAPSRNITARPAQDKTDNQEDGIVNQLENLKLMLAGQRRTEEQQQSPPTNRLGGTTPSKTIVLRRRSSSSDSGPAKPSEWDQDFADMEEERMAALREQRRRRQVLNHSDYNNDFF